MDFELGTGFWEWSGELIWSYYRVPVFNRLEGAFERVDPVGVVSWNFYSDLKYEFPFLPGAFVVYRFDVLRFGNEPEETGRSGKWDNGVLRHALGLGYRVNEWLLVKGAVSTQDTDETNWRTQQRTFRLMTSIMF